MHKTMLYLEDDLWQALRAQAQRKRRSAASLVREALRQFIQPPRRQKRLSFIGTADGPRDDTARRADDVLKDLMG